MARPSNRHPCPRRRSPQPRLRFSLITAVCLARTLTACGGSGSGSGDTDSANLKFSRWGADARAKLTEEAIATFKDQNPG